ncbi:MAG: DUF4115 domain-containing protein [Candidatus Competibacteraceae bacterium]
MLNKIVQNLTAPAGENSETLGDWFARIRASHGLDRRDIAHHLGLSLNIIHAIEDNALERLGPAVFARGYISRYARLLNLPEQEALERYKQQSNLSQEPPPLQMVVSTRRQARVRDLRGLFYLLLVVGIGWTAAQYLSEVDFNHLTALWPGQKPANNATVTKPAVATAQVQYPFQPKPPEESTTITTPTTEAPPTIPSTPASATVALEPPPLALPPVVPDSSPILAVSGVDAATAAPTTMVTSAGPEAGSNPNLVLEFSSDCWVEVKDSQGKVLMNGLMKANTTSQLSGAAPFTITLGNAPAARITLGGKTVDRTIYVPRRGTVSRFTLNPS